MGTKNIKMLINRVFPLESSSNATVEMIAEKWSTGDQSRSTLSLEHKDEEVRRGSHPSAAILYKEFLNTEMLEMVCHGYWIVVPYSAIRHLFALKISPAGVVPQGNRRPQTIVDYTYSGVNQTWSKCCTNRSNAIWESTSSTVTTNCIC
jgi:hypothetical protein